MREISLHILDIAQNSIAAGASRLLIRTEADDERDTLTVCVKDNGRGMSPEFLAKVTDPFVTTRTTRRVGLGIPMLQAAAEATGGGVVITSEVGKGTTTTATFGLRHIDRAPYGDIVGTIISLIAPNPDLSFRYEHSVSGREFALDTDEVKAHLDDVPISDPMVVKWIREYVEEGIARVGSIS